MEKAIEQLKDSGARIIDPFVIPNFDELTKDIWCSRFRHDVNTYLASLDETAPYKSLKEIFDSGLYLPYIEERLKNALNVNVPPEKMNPPCLDVYHDPRNIAFREAVLKAMKKDNVDAVIYPTWSNPPRKIGDMKSPAGDNSQLLSPHTGFPAITVPMGFTYGTLPAGLTFVGKLFGEPDLIKFAYAYEQATQHRRPPGMFPQLKEN
jgi:Asp-tRNA(Asn)/Glu-tRNA(Gln) amidotransferase A subunit family amidase